MDIKKSIEQFMSKRKPDDRYSSFDYCYNYFYGFYKEGKIGQLSDENNWQESCLQLGFYLASWGMMRGSTLLLKKSARNFKKVIDLISGLDVKFWKIDANNYTDSNIALLLHFKNELEKLQGYEKTSDTLITKIMLGVFANVPAFDQYFRKSFSVHTFNKESLITIKQFYENNKELLDSNEIWTLDFKTGEYTQNRYTKAKLIDMCGFINAD